jgi:hypothetical protein
MPLQIETQPFQFNSTVTGLSSAVFSSVSAVSLSGIHYGDGSKLTGISTYNGSDIKALTGNWQSTYGSVSSLSANWSSAYNYVNTTSATNNPTYNATTFSKLSSQPYTLNASTSSIKPSLGNNTSLGLYTSILGGTNNSALSSYNLIGNGNCNSIIDSCNTIVNSFNSSISGTCVYSGTYNLCNYGTPANILNNNLIGGGCNNKIIACAAASDYYDQGYCINRTVVGCSIVCSNSIVNGNNNSIKQLPQTASNYYTNPASNSGCINVNNNFIGNGVYNSIAGSCSTVVNGVSGSIASDFSFIGTGLKNCTTNNHNFIGTGICNTASGTYSSILGGCRNNSNNRSNTFILGSNITAGCANYTYVNNLSSSGKICAATLYGDGSALSNIAQNIYACNNAGVYIIDGSNTVADNGNYSCKTHITASGCYNNITTNSGYYGRQGYSAIVAGAFNKIASQCNPDFDNLGIGTDVSYSFIGNGSSNCICSANCGIFNSIAGSWTGSYSNTNYVSILNGNRNTIFDGCCVTNCTTSSAFATIINGQCNRTCNNAAYGLIGNGYNNKIISGCFNTILNGSNNSLSGTNNFILGSNISVGANNYTFVNNLSSQGTVVSNPLAVANSQTATVGVGSISGKFKIFDANGNSLGFVPIYTTIT